MSFRPIHPADDADRDFQVHARRHFRTLIAKSLVYFAEREADNLRLVRDHLLVLVDARPSQAQAQNLRSAYTLLGKQADAFHRAFRTAIQSSIDDEARLALPTATAAGQLPVQRADLLDGMSLSLIDVCEVDRILLLDRVNQRFSAYYDASLGPLSQRLGVLLGLDAPCVSSNPFRPEVFIRAFLSAWEKCELDDQATQDLMQTLDPRHCLNLAPLYDDLNATLMQAGVAAQQALRIRKTVGHASNFAPLSSAPTPTPSPSIGASGVESPQNSGSVPRSRWAGLAPTGRNIATHARQFLQRLGLGARTSAPDEDEGLTWTEAQGEQGQPTMAAADPEFMGYLGDLQAGAGASSSYQFLEGQDPGDHNILRQMRDLEQVRRAPELDRGTVDALAEVFDFVFADQAIPVQMKFVIGRLQIPVLKAAMIDRDFFLSADHPARRLVDTLASASVAWAPEKGENDPLYVRIETTVKRVLNEFEDDLDLFSELLLNFTEFLFETEQQAQGRIEPTADHERKGESFDQALAHADEIIHARIKALPQELPLAPFLAPFLTTQWREVLARAWQNSEPHPQQWESALTTMDQLVWSTQAKTKSDERRQLVAVLPDLVRSLNEGLDAIDWNGKERATFTRRLISTHMLAIRMTQPAAADTTSAVLEEHAGREAMQELDERLANQLAGAGDAFDALAQTFTRGLWFDFTIDPTTQHRCRLSWVSPMRTRLLFTNRDGFDAFVRSEREVAALLRLGRLSVINETPIVSRALDRIMSDGDQKLVA
jgi:hypothetical protein